VRAAIKGRENRGLTPVAKHKKRKAAKGLKPSISPEGTPAEKRVKRHTRNLDTLRKTDPTWTLDIKANVSLRSQARPALENLRCVVVNLDRRPDRMEGFAQRFVLRCPVLKFERFSATDGRATQIPLSEVSASWNNSHNVVYQRQRSIRKGWDDLHTYQERTLPLSAGERGCSSSHVRAWRRCVELAGDTDTPLLVLEDDAAPTPEFSDMLARAMAALPSDAGLLYLGYSQAANWRREVSPELVESEYVWTTVAYIVWPECARKMLSCLPVNEPVDNWMAGLCSTGELKAYCVRPKIVLQSDTWNVNSDVAHSDEHYWGPCSDILHSDDPSLGGPQALEVGSDRAGEPCIFGMLSDSEDTDLEE